VKITAKSVWPLDGHGAISTEMMQTWLKYAEMVVFLVEKWGEDLEIRELG